MTNNPYPDLREAFTDFIQGVLVANKVVPTYREAFTGHLALETDEGTSLRKLCRELGIDRTEFFQRFSEPWRHLSPEQAQEVAKYINLGLIRDKRLLMEITPIDAHRALQWTLVNVHKANLVNIFLDDYKSEFAKPEDEADLITHAYIAPMYSLPYKQCHFCGRLDRDPRGKPFGKGDLFFCNLVGCPPGESNPNEHMKGCCYADWQSLKRNIRRRCDNHKKDPKRVVKVFLDFCNKRYRENLKIEIPVQVQKEKPRGWRHPFDILAITVYKPDKQS